jgi:hypothetical protein
MTEFKRRTSALASGFAERGARSFSLPQNSEADRVEMARLEVKLLSKTSRHTGFMEPGSLVKALLQPPTQD